MYFLAKNQALSTLCSVQDSPVVHIDLSTGDLLGIYNDIEKYNYDEYSDSEDLLSSYLLKFQELRPESKYKRKMEYVHSMNDVGLTHSPKV